MRLLIPGLLSIILCVVCTVPLWAQADSAAKSNAENGTRVESSSGSTPKEKAPKKAAIPSNPQEIVQQLGWYTVAPFLLASVIALWFAIERLVVLRRGRVIPRPFVERFLRHLQHGKLNSVSALSLCEENGSPVAQVFAHGVRKWGKPSVEVEQAIIDGGERQVAQLRKHLRIINGVATITPLMGLLGTVIGMIFAFNEIARSDAMGNASQLAVGIAVALLTTAAGLAIAIPALILYMFLAGRVDSLVMEMDLLAQNVVDWISAESLSRTKTAPAKASKPRPPQVARTT